MSEKLWVIMWQKKFDLILFGLVAIGVALFLNKVLPKTYTVTNGLRIGRFMGVPLELSEYTKQRFKMVGFLADAYEAAGVDPEVSRDLLPRTVRVSIENDFNKQNNVDTLIFTTRAKSPTLAQRMSKALSDHVQRVHGKKLAEAKQIRELEIGEWRQNIQGTRDEIAKMETRLENAGNRGELDDAALFILSSKLQEQRNILFHMIQLRQNTTFKNKNPVESFNTEVVSGVRAPMKPSFPQLIPLLAACLFLAAAAWFLMCWLRLFVSQWQSEAVNLPKGNNLFPLIKRKKAAQ